MLSKAKERVFDDSESQMKVKMQEEESKELMSFELSQNDKISIIGSSDYVNMPRNEIEKYRTERDSIFKKIRDLQEALKNDAIKEDFENIVKQLLDFTTQPERVVYDLRMTKMLDDIDSNEANEVDRISRFSRVLMDEEIFYTPGDHEMLPIMQETKLDQGSEFEARAAQIIQIAKNWKPINRSDDFRAPDAASAGGFILDDPVVL